MRCFRKSIPSAAIWVYLGFAALDAAGAASDLERERRLAVEIEDAILDGEPIYLNADTHEFLALYTESDANQPRRAALILHGRGFHPDWPDVVGPLRVELPGHGWHTLSLQLPVLGKDAKYYDYIPIFPEAFPRIEAGIGFLREQGVEHIALIAHSCAVHMSVAWFEQYGDDRIDAYVGIGMGATDYRQPMAKPLPLQGMKVPILDLFGKEEYPAVLRMAPERMVAIKQAGNPKSRQIMVDGADHHFADKNETLVEAVAGWLNGL